MKFLPEKFVLQVLLSVLLSTTLFSQSTLYSSGHIPANAAKNVTLTPTLRWTAGEGGTRHEVYFGTSEAAVQIAGRSSPEYKGRLSTTSYSPGALSPATDYYWRVDETNTAFTPLYSGQTLRFTTAGNARRLPLLSGKTVAIWSKGAQRFVRSPGGPGGGLLADRDAYSANGGEGRFLFVAESDDKIAIIDTLLQQYVALVGDQVVSASTQPAAARRFTLIDLGNNYYAIQAVNGKYVRVNALGVLIADLSSITTDAHFAIVPIRTGPDVVMRAYKGDDPTRLPGVPNELAQFTENPADFPVNKVNIGTLQMTAILSSDQQFRDMLKVWNTKRYEDEAIIPFNITMPLVNQIDSVISNIKRIESLGYEYAYVILYHEILADLPGGPWSDPRISSQEEIDLFHTRVQLAHGRGELRHPRYKVFAMPYQFQPSLMGIPPYADTPVGCDAATLEFIKQNFDGMFLEVNGHDYLSRDEPVDAALAAVWCRANGLEFGLTSGGATNKDTVFKTMYRNIFSEMEKVGFDKSWSGNHYVLHHVYQPYENRLPEWVADTTTNNAKWLIEQVMLNEAWSLREFDTDGDGTSDEDEIRAGTYPLGPGGLLVPPDALAYEDFNFYTTGVLNAQAGSPTGFSGSWASSGATVNATEKTITQTGGSYRTSRSFTPVPLASSGVVTVRATVALAANGNYSALELATTAGSDSNSIRLTNIGTSLGVSVIGNGGTGSPAIVTNDGQRHHWVLQLNFDTREGRASIDGGPWVAFSMPLAFQLNAVNIATFSLGQPGDAAVTLREMEVTRREIVVDGPKPFVNTEFNVDGNFEGWTTFSGLSSQNVAGGVFSGQAATNDPLITKNNLQFAGSEVPYLLVRMRSSENRNAQLAWGTLNSPGFSGTRSMTASYTGNNDWQVLVFPMLNHSEWTGEIISSLRLNPPSVAGATFAIDWIRTSSGNLISTVSGQTVTVNTAIPALPFSLGAEIASEPSFAVTATSSNTDLVRNENIVVSGTGVNRTVTVTPISNRVGSAKITLTVGYGALIRNTEFLVTVIEGAGQYHGNEFNNNGNFENWGPFQNIGNQAVGNGVFSAQALAINPVMIRNNLNFAGSAVPYLMLRIKASVTSTVKLYWGTLNTPGHSESRSMVQNYTGNGAWQTLVFPLLNHAAWPGQTITSLRLDPVRNATGTTFEIDWIRIATSAGQTWRLMHFDTADNIGPAADGFDADGDGESNLLEFATAQNPHAATLVDNRLSLDGNLMDFTYSRSIAALNDGAVFIVEWSESLTQESWNTVESEEILDNNGITQFVMATLPFDSQGNVFMRLRVLLP